MLKNFIKKAGKKVLVPLCAVLCLLSALYVYAAVLSGGNLTIPVIVTTSGGGVTAAGGNLSVSAMSMGQNAAGVNMTGGNFTLLGGITQAIAITDTIKADLSGAHCYPVPFKPSLGHTKITFKSLTRDAGIKIYTVSGELVKTINKSDSTDFIEWDVKNSRGEALASGVYIYIIKCADGSKSGKLMVIK